MADIEAVAEVEVVAPVTPETQEEISDLNTAIRKTLQFAKYTDGVLCGLHEVVKAVDSGKAKICFLAESCNEPAYKKLVQALCAEQGVPLVEVADNKTLGEWAGLCKIDKDGNPRKVVGASSVAVVDFGEESTAKAFLLKQVA